MTQLGLRPPAPPSPPEGVPLAWVGAAYLLPGLAAGLAARILEALRYFCSSPPPQLIPGEAVVWVAPALTVGLPLITWTFVQPARPGSRFLTTFAGFLLGCAVAFLAAGADEKTLADPAGFAVDALGSAAVVGGVLGVVAAGLLELVIGFGRWVQGRVLLRGEPPGGDAP